MAVVEPIRVNPAEMMLIKRGGGTTHMQSLFLRILLLACLTSITTTELLSQQSQRSSTPTAEATGDESHNSNLLRQFNGSLQALVAKVSRRLYKSRRPVWPPWKRARKAESL